MGRSGMAARHFLIVRLSSMGDVVLTTPLIRALHALEPEAELHYLTRPLYRELLVHHPHLTAVHEWPPSAEMRAMTWDGIIDLQKNLRTLFLRRWLSYKRWHTFPKANLRKWLAVRLKKPLPVPHVVLRYGEALRAWGVRPERLGLLEVFIPLPIQDRIKAEMRGLHAGPWLAVGLGGTYATKRWPLMYHLYFLNRLGWPAVLLGGPAEQAEATFLAEQAEVPVLVGAGRYGLLETAAAIAEADLVLTHDTGTAHISAAFQKPTAVLWGNTILGFGMAPWQTPTLSLEVPGLSCRPCSKLGYARCPQGHHNCMRALTPDWVWAEVSRFWQETRPKQGFAER